MAALRTSHPTVMWEKGPASQGYHAYQQGVGIQQVLATWGLQCSVSWSPLGVLAGS